jgi:hypothetical protein
MTPPCENCACSDRTVEGDGNFPSIIFRRNPSVAQQSIYDLREASIAQRVTLTIAIAGFLALAWWLLVGGGITSVGI